MNYPAPIRLSETITLPKGPRFVYCPENRKMKLTIKFQPDRGNIFWINFTGREGGPIKPIPSRSRLYWIILIILVGPLLMLALPAIRRILERNIK